MDKQQTLQEVSDWLDRSKALIDKFDKRWQAQLAEAEKPELRHWDLGIDDEGRGFVVLSQATLPGSPEAFFSDGCGLVNVGERMSPATRVGTLKKVFDDLKAMAEDLEKAETVSLAGLTTTYWIDKAGDLLIDIKTNEKQTVVKTKDIPTLILNLRRMYATQERKKNGNTH